MIALISLVCVLLFLIGSPVLVVLGLWSVGISLVIDMPLANFGVTLFEGLNAFALLAMPLFILTGDLINAAGIARKLTAFAHACLGWMRGGFGMATLGACGAFAAISGSNAATAATIGAIMHPQMKDDGYDPEFSAVTIASGGTVGIIIPPSILFITYGFLTNLSINDLFTAGVAPGVLMILGMMLVCFVTAWRNKWGKLIPFSPVKAVRAGAQAYLGFIAIFVIMFGISSGAFSPTESAAICVGFCFFAGLLVTRELHLRNLPEILFSSGKMVGMVAPLVAVSMAMQQVLSSLGISTIMSDLFGGMGYTGDLLCSKLIIFLAGMVLESVPVVTIFAPILAPVAAAAGINPIQFAMVLLVGTAIGFITPPFGLNLFVVSTVTGLPYNRLLRHVPFYLAALLTVWFSIAFIPSLSLFLL